MVGVFQARCKLSAISTHGDPWRTTRRTEGLKWARKSPRSNTWRFWALWKARRLLTIEAGAQQRLLPSPARHSDGSGSPGPIISTNPPDSGWKARWQGRKFRGPVRFRDVRATLTAEGPFPLNNQRVPAERAQIIATAAHRYAQRRRENGTGGVRPARQHTRTEWTCLYLHKGYKFGSFRVELICAT